MPPLLLELFQTPANSRRGGACTAQAAGILLGHQALRPSRTMMDGRMTIRTRVASTRTAMARPIPICFISIIPQRGETAKTDTITAAALVTTPADSVTPSRTASCGVSPRWTPSRIRPRTNTW